MSCKVTCSSAYELLSIEHEIFYTDGKNGIKTIELKKRKQSTHADTSSQNIV